MGIEKLVFKSRADKASRRLRCGSLPLKKRRFRLNFIDDAPDSQIVAIDSSYVNDENSDRNSSLFTPKSSLSCTLPQTPKSVTQASEPSSPNSVRGRFPENSIMGTTSTNLPRLVTPLPNGCHWRTARNKSYCRRRPCYNSSNFCKLHYQQCTNAFRHDPSSPTDGNKAETVPQHTVALLKTSPELPMLPNILHQDKRFTEAPGEVNCTATTTRGRRCAYVAVNETKFCYLHSHYDKSRPASRRNSCNMCVVSSNPSSSLTSQSSLSSLPTGTWLHRSVLIATGPLQGRTGTVEKWGNGWVSVGVPGVGLHNRRSFELLLTAPIDGIRTNFRPNLRPAQSIPSSRVTRVSDSSFSSDGSSSQTRSMNRSIMQVPVPTLIVTGKSATQNIINSQAGA
ncbi:unnamed protein product [Cylindrotheca closterium]|uniref:Uncharacterized protein n=1 Tax=Cylindrotheca closterium TaxID=2856 RepID=A0AAD2FN62_9STRA|nr:unnamed protein product [Cylindrotheca closterium]